MEQAPPGSSGVSGAATDLTIAGAPASDPLNLSRGRQPEVPSQTAREHLRENFAHLIADILDAGRVENKYQHLVIVAAPKLLGDIRAKLSSATQQLVSAEIDKEMTGQDLSVICALIDAQV
jgi:protein required for attachment to host cells